MDKFQPTDYTAHFSNEQITRYMSKINDLQISDPYGLPDVVFTTMSVDMELPAEYPDVYNYLINFPSLFSGEALCAYKSLDSYLYRNSGFVSRPQMWHLVNKKITILIGRFSKSEVILTFFERSPLDQVLRNDKIQKIQPFQKPIKISEIMRSNGFCLANTETIVFDDNVTQDKDRPSSTDSAQHLYDEDGKECQSAEQDVSDDDTEAYVTNLSYYHLVPFETDILE